VDLFASILYDKLGSLPEYLRDSIAIVVMFSMIETLQLATKKYVMLHDWLQSDECAKKLDDLTVQGLDADQRMKALIQTYFSTYGSAHAASDFVENYLPIRPLKAWLSSSGLLRSLRGFDHQIRDRRD